MHLFPTQKNFLTVPQPQQNNSMETPTKKGKIGFNSNIKTAQSPNLIQSQSKLSIADIDAQQLFENFSRIVTVSQSNEEFQQESPYRKIQYNKENNKLSFDISTNSMKKKRRGSRILPEQEGQCIKVKPFILNEIVCTQSESNNNAQDSQMIQENNQDNIMRDANGFQDLSPGLRKKTSKTGMMSTPTKKPIRNLDLERAAKKQDPFRDLKCKLNINA